MSKLALWVLLFSVFLIPQSFALSCTSDNQCFDNKFCTSDKCVTTRNCPGNCTGSTCVGCKNESKCVNNNLASCDEKRYIDIGEYFLMGSGNCETRHFYHGPVVGEFKIKIDDGLLSYNASSGNVYGFLVRLQDKATGLTYQVRYNNNSKSIYLEDFPPCPLADSCSSNMNCQDQNSCTIDECDGTPLRCFHRRVKWCRDNDGCCPRYLDSCSFQNDNDCYECDRSEDCDDSDESTYDVCDTKQKQCTHLKIALCKNNDRKCEKGCSFSNDNDCLIPKSCGDGKCSAGEDCCADCGCPAGLECSQSICRKSNATLVNESFHNNSIILGELSRIQQMNYVFMRQELGKRDGSVYAVSQVYAGNDSIVNVTALMSSDGKLINLVVTTKMRKSIHKYLQFLLIVILVLFIMFLIHAKVRKFRKRKLLSFILKSQNYTKKQQSFYYDEYGNPKYERKL